MNVEVKQLKSGQAIRWRGVCFGPDGVETRFSIESQQGADSGSLFALHLTANFAGARLSDEIAIEMLSEYKNDYRAVTGLSHSDFNLFLDIPQRTTE